MISDLPANVTAAPDRHGKMRYRFRRKGWKSVYLPGEPGEARFHAAYAKVLEGGEVEPEPAKAIVKAKARSLDDLFVKLKKTPRWKKKAPRTQHVSAQVIQRFLDRKDKKGRRYGERPVESVTVAWLDKILGGMHQTPGAANDLRKKLSGMMDMAIKMGWRIDNPARLTDRYDDGEGFHDWTDEEIDQYRAAHPLGTMARLTLELALNTAARRCNVNKVERDHIKNGRIKVAHAKGNNETSVRMLATTKAAIDALPAAPIKYLVTTVFGKPFSDAGMGNRMRAWCDTAGLPHCSLHGLRKAMSRQLAESGATDAEGQAITGHKKATTFAYYRANANRTALADRAMSNLEHQRGVQPIESDGDSDG